MHAGVHPRRRMGCRRSGPARDGRALVLANAFVITRSRRRQHGRGVLTSLLDMFINIGMAWSHPCSSPPGFSSCPSRAMRGDARALPTPSRRQTSVSRRSSRPSWRRTMRLTAMVRRILAGMIGFLYSSSSRRRSGIDAIVLHVRRVPSASLGAAEADLPGRILAAGGKTFAAHRCVLAAWPVAAAAAAASWKSLPELRRVIHVHGDMHGGRGVGGCAALHAIILLLFVLPVSMRVVFAGRWTRCGYMH
uniref:Uncharacterized protein n=1 Tax=Leersia perrieri TaxID=77586 RepID=A0A0D9XUK3_9ORYZ